MMFQSARSGLLLQFLKRSDSSKEETLRLILIAIFFLFVGSSAGPAMAYSGGSFEVQGVRFTRTSHWHQGNSSGMIELKFTVMKDQIAEAGEKNCWEVAKEAVAAQLKISNTVEPIRKEIQAKSGGIRWSCEGVPATPTEKGAPPTALVKVETCKSFMKTDKNPAPGKYVKPLVSVTNEPRTAGWEQRDYPSAGDKNVEIGVHLYLYCLQGVRF